MSWDSLETLLTSYENDRARDHSRSKAAFRALERLGSPRERAGPSLAVFRCVETGELLKNLIPPTHDRALMEAYRSFFSALLDFRSCTAVSDIGSVLRDAAASAHQLKRQLYQTRTQALFLSLLVPFFSIIFVCLRWDNFLSNVSTQTGVISLAASVLIYAVGLLLLQQATKLSVGEFGGTDLGMLGGQEAFLRRLRQTYRSDRHGLRSLQLALLSQGDPRGRHLARAAAFAERLQSGGVRAQRCAREVFTESLWDGFVCQTHARRRDWLRKSYDNAVSQICLSQSKLGAQLNLRLILVMGIFFLPAFFLILGICGTVVSSPHG